MLEIRDLAGAHFGPLGFAVAAGELCFLAGPSGSGKTLTLRAIVDLDPHAGEVLLGGEEQSSMPAPEWRRRVGYLPARPAWWGPRVREHFPAERMPDLAPLGLERGAIDWETDRLSSGEGQRLALLRLLARRPSALLLDEPCANLDPESASLMEALLLRYSEAEGAPLLWVEHDAGRRERLGGKTVFLASGRLLP